MLWFDALPRSYEGRALKWRKDARKRHLHDLCTAMVMKENGTEYAL